jgi:putative phosphoribosyl transferase
MIFRDRKDAGQKLALALREKHLDIEVVLGLPRGGVVCANEVAKIYQIPLGMLFTRKIRHPHSPDFAVGAIAEKNIFIKRCESVGLDEQWLENEVHKQKIELNRQKSVYLTNRPTPILKNKVIVVVDDGLASGVTMEAALEHLITHNPKKIIVAVPVSPPSANNQFLSKINHFFTLNEAERFYSSGGFYENFTEIEDHEILTILG